jgi:hypothetical protein
MSAHEPRRILERVDPSTPGAAQLEPCHPRRGSFFSRAPIATAIGALVLALLASSTAELVRSPRAAEDEVAPARATDEAPSGNPHPLFSSGFEGAIEVSPPKDCWDTGCWQDVVGLDGLAQFQWPAKVSGRSRFLLLTNPVPITPLTLGDFMLNRIDTVTGHRGDQTHALFQQISRNVNGTAPMGTAAEQNAFQLLPLTDVRDLYISYWIKLQPDLVAKMNGLPDGPGVSRGGTWRAFFALKTGGQTAWGDPADDGDYRIEVYVLTYGGGRPYWAILGDNNAGGGAPRIHYWDVENRSVPVPVDQWFKFEIFWHRSSAADGRVWMAIDGQVIADRRGANVGERKMPINRIMAPLLYSGSAMPIYQWVDDLEIWDGVPPATGGLAIARGNDAARAHAPER